MNQSDWNKQQRQKQNRKITKRTHNISFGIITITILVKNNLSSQSRFGLSRIKCRHHDLSFCSFPCLDCLFCEHFVCRENHSIWWSFWRQCTSPSNKNATFSQRDKGLCSCSWSANKPRGEFLGFRQEQPHHDNCCFVGMNLSFLSSSFLSPLLFLYIVISLVASY